MQYTCNSCGLGFATPEDQRAHMKSDWHRYNLKRRVAGLPAIDEEMFVSKVAVLAVEEPVVETPQGKIKKLRGRKGGKTEDEVERTVTKKEQKRRELAEKKRQLLEEAMKNNGAKSQLEQTSDAAVKDETKETDTFNTDDDSTDIAELEEKLMSVKLENAVVISPEVCLFCNKSFKDQETALDHMFKNHGLYIPEQKYLVDKMGLMAYLAEKVGLGNVCLVCDYQGRTLEAVRAHMLSKSHCRLPYESENEKLEISEFYDFTSTYDNDEGEGEGEEWEDVEEDEENDEEDISDTESELPQDLSYSNGFELHLPSGAVVGHRSLQRYYRQNLAPERVLSEGQGTVIAAEARHMMNIADRAEMAEKKRTWAREKKREDVNDRRAAKFVNNQPYYRDQLLQ